MSDNRQRLFALAFACIGWTLAESACVDYNRPPYNSTSTSVCHACVSDPCGMPCTFCTEGRISKSAYCTSDLSQCSTENQKRRQIDCPQQETTKSSSERQQKNEISTSVTAYFDCSRDRVVLGNEAAINMGISKQILLSNKVQGENSVPYDMLANLCSSVKNLTCPLSSSPILAVNKGLDDCIEIGERVSNEIYLNNVAQGLSGGFQLSLGRIRCCSNSNLREINATLQILCNSNSPGLELGETDVLLKLRNCTGLNNLTVTLLSPQLCSENIASSDLLPGWAKAVIVLCGVLLLVLVFAALACKSKKRCRRSSKGRVTETSHLLPGNGSEQTTPADSAPPPLPLHPTATEKDSAPIACGDKASNDRASGDGASADGTSSHSTTATVNDLALQSLSENIKSRDTREEALNDHDDSASGNRTSNGPEQTTPDDSVPPHMRLETAKANDSAQIAESCGTSVEESNDRASGVGASASSHNTTAKANDLAQSNFQQLVSENDSESEKNNYGATSTEDELRNSYREGEEGRGNSSYDEVNLTDFMVSQ